MADIVEETTEADGTPNSIPKESVSFGRFEGDNSLSWDKWSTFSQNKYMEEAEKCSTPGSVAEKKAYFEAHYRKISSQTIELLEQDHQIHPMFLKSPRQNFHDSSVHFKVSEDEQTAIKSDSVEVEESKQFSNGTREEETWKPENGKAKVVEMGEGLDFEEVKKVEQPDILETMVRGLNDEAESLESLADKTGKKPDLVSNKLKISAIDDMGNRLETLESKGVDSSYKILDLKSDGVVNEHEILVANVESQSNQSEACTSKVDETGAKSRTLKTEGDGLGERTDIPDANGGLPVKHEDNFRESEATFEHLEQLDMGREKHLSSKSKERGQKQIYEHSKQKTLAMKKTNLNGTEKKLSVSKAKLPEITTPKALKVTSTSPLSPASSMSSRKGSHSSRSESKHLSPTLVKSTSPGPSGLYSASPPTSRTDLIMERMGDKEIVQKAFKTFKNSFSLLRSPTEAERPSLQASLLGKQQDASLEKSRLQKEGAGSRNPSSVERPLRESREGGKTPKDIFASPGSLSDKGSKKRTELADRKPNGKEAQLEKANRQAKVKEEQVTRSIKLPESTKFGAIQVPDLKRRDGISRNLVKKLQVNG